MRTHFQSLAGSRRGAVIVLVLGLITLAAFLLSQFIERAMTEMLVESRARQAERLRADAHSALEASLAVLADYQAVDEGLHAPAQGWGTPLDDLDLVSRDGRIITAEIEDESGLISLPRLGQSGLIELGEKWGLKKTEAEQLADALLAWTRREHASNRIETDPRRYEFANPPHRPPGRPLASFAELAAITGARDFFYTPAGRPTRLREEFVRNVSLHYFSAANLNSALPATLALMGLDEDQVGKVIAYRRGEVSRATGAPPFFRSVAEAQTALGVTALRGRFDTQARCLRVKVAVQEGGTVLRLTAVVAPVLQPLAEGETQTATSLSETSKLRYPFRLLAFEEHVESAVPSAL